MLCTTTFASNLAPWRRLQAIVLVGVAFLFSGCVGATGVITLDDLEYPASMSASLHGEGDQILTAGQQLTVVEDFEYSTGFWGLAYGTASLSSDASIAAAINEGVEKAHGDGIVNLSFETAGSGLNVLWYITWLSGLPIVPGRVDVTVKGQIVKAKR